MKNVLLIFLMYPWILFSQGYSFNYKCTEFETRFRSPYKGNERTNYIYINTKDSTILAYDYKFSTGKNLFIIDTEHNIYWNFDRNNLNKPLSLINFSTIKEYEDEFIVKDVIVEKIDNLSYNVSLYSKKGKKKPRVRLKIDLVASKIPIQKFRFMDLSMNIHLYFYDALMKEIPSQFYQLKSVITEMNGVVMRNEFNCKEEDIFFDVSPFLK